MKKLVKFRRNRGITLIALVITIVILIILSTITINFAFGENGLVSITEDARDITTEATEKEGIEMAVADSKIKDITTPDREKENLEESLRSQFGNNANFTVTENGDGSFLINMNDSQRSYYVESTGEILAQSEMIEIGTAEELKAFRDEVNSGNTFEGKYIRLTNNITLDINEEWEPIGKLMDNSSKPYDDLNMRFSGIFNGNGYEINGILINTSDKVQGLFGLVDSGKIINLCIGENNNITGGAATSALVGYLYNESIVSNCSNKSNIIGVYSGGIVGCAYSNSKILDSYNTGIIEGDRTSGGIAGTITTDSVISGCYNTGNITVKSEYAGGIVGENIYNTIVEKCYNCGIISGESFIGGIAGHNAYNSIIRLSYNTNIIKGSTSNIGGIVGKNYLDSELYDSYNAGTINGNGERIGGVIGYNQDSKVSNCYNIGKITTSDANSVGGVIGAIQGNSTEENNYFLENMVNNGNGIVLNGVESKKETEMKSLAPILGSAFTEDIEGINQGYPILSWQ